MENSSYTIHNKKGQIGSNLGRKLTPLVIVIITIVVLFQIFSALVPEVQSAGDSMNASNSCAAVGCFFNTTVQSTSTNMIAGCRLNSSMEGNNTACDDPLGKGLPLSGIFGSGGIIVLLLMVFLLIGIIRTVLPKKGK